MLVTHARPRAMVRCTPLWSTVLVLLTACGGGSSGSTTEPPPTGEIGPRPTTEIPVRALALGDTVAADRSSSVERFVYVAPRAQQLAVYSACTAGDVAVRRVPSLAAPISIVVFFGPGACGSPLLSTWRIESAAPGDSVIIEVLKQAGTTGIRLALVARDTLPEQGPRSVAIGDTLAGVLEHPADEDVIEVAPPGPGTYVLYAQSTAPVGAAALRVAFEPQAARDTAVVASAVRDADLESLRSPRITLPNGSSTARLRVTTTGSRATAPGPMNYRVQVRRVDAAVESGSAQLTIGAVRASALEHSADVDLYEAELTDSSRYVLYFRHRSGPASGRIGVRLPRATDDSTRIVAQVASRLGDPSPFGTALVLRDIVFAELGSERVRFAVAPARDRSPDDAGILQIDRGAYDLQVVRIDQAPEQAPAVLRLNDSVTIERLERPLDVDLFALVGTYDRAVIQVRSPSGSIGAQFDDGSGRDGGIERLPGQPVFFGGEVVRENPGDTVWIAVNSAAQLDGDVNRFYEGPYVLTFREIRPEPETAASALQPNQIISESLDFPGDVDRFTYTAADRQRVRVRFAGPFDVVLDGIQLQLAPTPANGELAPIGDVFELPAGQVLEIEVVPPRGGYSLRDAGPYRLQVERLP